MTETVPTQMTAVRATHREVAGSVNAEVSSDASPTRGVVLRGLQNVALGRTVGYELVLPMRAPNAYERRALADGRAPIELEVNRHVRLIHVLLDRHLLGNGHTLVLPIRPSLPGVSQRGLGALLDTLRNCALPAERLILQMDEGRAIGDIQSARQLIRTLRARGYQVSISAFGSGFEGLKELVTCPPDFLRLSPDLTNQVLSDRAQRSVVKAICGVARDLSISLVADEVNSSEAADLLRHLGVVLQQGAQHGVAQSLDSLLAV